MANKSFLSDADLIKARERLVAARPESVRETFFLQEPMNFSKYLGELLEKRLSQHPNWRAARPVALGSWARGEICIKSDIDLLFLGDEPTVKKLVDDFNLEGLKLRYRVPKDASDWSINVEAFDVLALFSAKCFFKSDEAELKAQVDRLYARGPRYIISLCRTMFEERAARAKRYDSIANYLEPNLKHGAGALRDLEQGLLLQKLFHLSETEASKLVGLKSFFLMIRHYLHLHEAGDVLIGPLQKDLADFLGYASIQKFMSDLEYSLSEVSFYADWYAESVRKLKGKKSKAIAAPAEVEAALALLNKDQSMAAQKVIRDAEPALRQQSADMKKAVGPMLRKYLGATMKPSVLEGLFRSKIMSVIIQELDRVTGLVQHDQYHRYSVDAHTLQALREVLRLKAKPKILGAELATLATSLTSEEYDILFWTALYHDLCKGKHGDHSSEGAKYVKRDFIRLGLPLKLTTQVAWMVQNHLILSQAAFRRNIQDPATWADLFKRGVRERRIPLLTLFTAIDIRATNPDAWNEWKQNLLAQLAQTLMSPSAGRLNQLLEYAEKKKVDVARDFIDLIDPVVVASISPQALLKDYKDLRKARADLEPLVAKVKRTARRAGPAKETWIRLHSRDDRAGLFVEFAERLLAAGLSVQEAFVQTYGQYGAYDWFKVRSDRSSKSLQVILKNQLKAKKADLNPASSNNLKVQFQTIEVVSENDSSITISFRGRDQRGAMLAAAQAIYRAGFEIISAKVHTWGRQIDDIFILKKGTDWTNGSLSTPDLERVLRHQLSV